MAPTIPRGTRAPRRPPSGAAAPLIALRPSWPGSAVRFSILFVAIVAVLSATVLVDEVSFNGAGVWVLCSKLAAVVATTMRWFDADVVAAGNQIRYGAFTCHVIPECTGIDFVGLFVAAVCAFPCAWESKFRALAVGVPILLALNVLRIVALVTVGARWPEALDVSHLYIAPLLILTTTLGLWLAWAEKASADGAHS